MRDGAECVLGACWKRIVVANRLSKGTTSVESKVSSRDESPSFSLFSGLLFAPLSKTLVSVAELSTFPLRDAPKYKETRRLTDDDSHGSLPSHLVPLLPVLVDQLLDDPQRWIILIGDAEDEFKVRVVLFEGRSEVLVEVWVETFERSKD